MSDLESSDIKDPVEIPADAIGDDVLSGIIDDFILRDGTDYGETEVTYESRLEQVRRQIKSGQVRIFF